MTNPVVPGTEEIPELTSEMSTVPPGAPFRKKTSAIAARTAYWVALDAPERPEIVKLIGLAIGAHANTSAVTGCT